MASSSIAKEKPRVDAQALSTNCSTNAKIPCFSWITRSGEELQVSTPKPLQQSTYKFLNFATVLGPARQGKSFLMNCLLGNSVFRTTDNIGVCTKGVQIATDAHEVGNGGCALFVDTEGQGDEDVDSDTTLLTPVILLSKVILYNWKGGFQKNQILNELAILVEVDNCVSYKSLEGDTSKFGHLHIVLRDFHFQGTTEEAFAIIFDEENRRGEKVKERNKIREKLLSSFESIDISIIPVPCEDLQNLDPNATSDEFQESVKELKDAILGQMSKPRRFGSVVISSENVDVLVRTFLKELEERGIVHVKSAISQLEREVVHEAKRNFKESLIKAFQEIDVPIKDELEELLVQKRDEYLDVFETATAKVDLEAVYRDDVLEDLDRFADHELDAKKKENLLAIQSRITEQNKILANAEEQFRSSMESELRSCQEGSMQVQQRFQERKQRLVNDFLKTTADLDWVPKDREKKLEELKTWASVRLEEKVEAKRKEEKYVERSRQQVCLSKAAEDFRSGVEKELASYQSKGVTKFRQIFQQEKQRLFKIFETSTENMHQISQLREAELERLKSWTEKKVEEKVQTLEREKYLRKEEIQSNQEDIIHDEEEICKRFEDIFVDSNYKIKKEVHEKLICFSWLSGAYGLTAATKKIKRPHIYLTVKRGMKKSDVRRDLEDKFNCDAKLYFELLLEAKRKPKFEYLGKCSSTLRHNWMKSSSLRPKPGGGVLACVRNSSNTPNHLRMPDGNDRHDLPITQGTGTLTMFCANNNEHYALTCFHVGCATDETELNATLNKKEDIEAIRSSLPTYVKYAMEQQYYFAEKVAENNNDLMLFGDGERNYSPLGNFHKHHFDKKCDIMSLKVTTNAKIKCTMTDVASPDWDSIRKELYERVFKGNNTVHVEKTGFSSDVSYGQIVPCDFSYKLGEELLFQDAYVVKGYGGPFLKGGDSGCPVFFQDMNDRKQIFAYGVCEMDELPIIKCHESRSLSSHENARAEQATTPVKDDCDNCSIWSEDESDGFEVEFQKENEITGPYFVCLSLHTALQNLGLHEITCVSECSLKRSETHAQLQI